jgi:hypothetical protein
LTSAVLNPSTSRLWHIEKNAAELVITIPRKFQLGFFLFVPIYFLLFFYFFGIPHGSVYGEIVFFVVFLMFICGWIWNLGGIETIIFAEGTVTVRRRLFGFTRSYDFTFEEIEGLRFVEKKSGKHGHPSGLGIWIDGNPFRVGDHMPESDANELIEIITGKWPQLRKEIPDAHFIRLNLGGV